MIRRGATFAELLVVVGIITVVAAALVIPGYQNYRAARAPADAAATLAEDIALLESAAHNGTRDQGATLLILSADPLVYRGYRGRPASVDPNSSLGAILVERHLPNVAIVGGPISVSTPLLFATNGSAQYVASGLVSDQHAAIEISLGQRPAGRTAAVVLDLFTGAVSLP